MARPTQQLRLQIEQAGQTSRLPLSKRTFTIGRHKDNDIVLLDHRYPKRHILFIRQGRYFEIRLPAHADGEVLSGSARLSFHDMIAHGLLQQKAGSFIYPLHYGNRGKLVVGDAQISFELGKQVRPDPEIFRFKGFSWTKTTLKDLGRDTGFKFILITLMTASSLLLLYMRDLPADLFPESAKNVVPQRLARIIVRNPAPDLNEDVVQQFKEPGEPGAENRDVSEREDSGSAAREDRSVLGLLTGSDVSGETQTGSLANFLLSEELVQELDAVISSTDLTIGRSGTAEGSEGGDRFDDLFAGIGRGGGGVDNLVSDLGGAKSVALQKSGQVNVDQGSQMTATQDALGKRSEDSVRAVLLRNTGRLTYIYNKYLKRDPELHGKLVVEVVIGADGRVAAVRRVSSNLNKTEFETEVIDFIKRWRYDPIDAGRVTVTYPLVFNKIS
jgi:TonB family protein